MIYLAMRLWVKWSALEVIRALAAGKEIGKDIGFQAGTYIGEGINQGTIDARLKELEELALVTSIKVGRTKRYTPDTVILELAKMAEQEEDAAERE